MKRYNKFIAITISIVLISAVFVFIATRNVDKIAKIAYDIKKYNISAPLFKYEYNKTHDIETLDKLCDSLMHTNNYKDKIYYLDILLKEESYIIERGEAYCDLRRISYLKALFNDGQKKDFRNKYINSINEFYDPFASSLIASFIARNPKSEKKDYELAVNECLKIISNKNFSNNHDLIGVYGDVIELSRKLGDKESETKYTQELKGFINKLKNED